MKGQCVIFFGQTQTIGLDGECPQEVQATLLGKILVNNLTTIINSKWLPELINLSTMDIPLLMKKTLSQSFQLPIIAIDVATRLQLWK